MVFWIITGLLAAGVAFIIATAILKARRAAEPPAAFDLKVYRDQLAEVQRDEERGIIAAEDAKRTTIEISRRILAADAQLKTEVAIASKISVGTAVLALGLAAVFIGGSFTLYSKLGAPGYSDLPLKQRKSDARERHDQRISQVAFEASLPPRLLPEISTDFQTLMVKLRETVAKRPDDVTGQELLARNEAAVGDFIAAHKAQAQVLRLKGNNADAQDFLQHADLMITAAEGYVSPEAQDALRKVLETHPKNGLARYYYGLMLIQSDRPDLGYRMWSTLLDEGPETAPWVAPIRSRIHELAALAGTEYREKDAPVSTGSALAGPSQDDIDGAASMTAEDRQEMIKGMVSQLSERLATEGGTSQEWARLISAYGVLGETERAAAIWANAQEVFATTPDAMSLIGAAAKQAGVSE